MDRRSRITKTAFALAAFLIPQVLTLVIFALGDIFPFGDNTILTGDLRSQFVTYFANLRDVILSHKEDTLYTFSKTIGGDYPGFKAYYLNNPILLILLFFPKENICYGVEAVLLLQVGLGGLFMELLLDDIKSGKWFVLLFSTAYAMNGFVFGDLVLLIYFSNVAILPLVVMYLRRILKEDRGWAGFVITSALAVYMSYYQGYMMMLFIALLFFGYAACDRSCIKKAVKIAGAMILSVMLTAFELVPAVLSLRGEKSSADADFAFYRKFAMTDFLNAFIPGRVHDTHLPLVYCTVFVLICALIYLVFPGKGQVKKLVWGIPFLGLILSMYINTLDAIWHGFNNPVGFPFRYAYMLSFVMICMGYEGMEQVMSVVGTGRGASFIKVIAILLFLEVFAETVYTDHHLYEAINTPGSSAIGGNEFGGYISAIGDAVDTVKDGDSGIYRIEKDFYFTMNDPMLFDYYGLSHSSSCEKMYINRFMRKMGFGDTGLYSFYGRGSTSFANSFMGIKYLISMYDTDKALETYGRSGPYRIYKNDNALPLCFATSGDILEADMSEEDPFILQNTIADKTGGVDDIYIKAGYEVSCDNAHREGTRIIRDDGSDGFCVTYRIRADRDGVLYYYLDAPGRQGAELFVNGRDEGPYFTENNWAVYTAGRFGEGDEIEIRLESHEDELDITGEYFYFEDEGRLKEWAGSVSDRGDGFKDPVMKSSSRILYDTHVNDGEILMMTIPYDKGWKVYADGMRCKTFPVLGVLMGIDPPSGAAHMEMRYIPEGLIAGILISILSWIIFFICVCKKVHTPVLTGK